MDQDIQTDDAWSDHVAHLLRGFAMTGDEAEGRQGFARAWPALGADECDAWRKAALSFCGLIARHAQAQQRERLRRALTAQVQRQAEVMRQPAITDRAQTRWRFDGVCAARTVQVLEVLAKELGIEMDDIIWQSASAVQPGLHVVAPTSAPEGDRAD